MTAKPQLHSHAVDRAKERFGLDDAWLLETLDSGSFVWLKGTGNSGSVKQVRSGHLIFLPEKDKYCIVVMDDRKRLAITVLTEEMARNSSWGIGMDDKTKLKAKRIALGEEVVDDSNFLRLYAEERGILRLSLYVRAFTKDWQLTNITFCKVEVAPEQIDPNSRTCELTSKQEQEATRCFLRQVNEQAILPYCDFYVRTTRGKKALIANKIPGSFSLEEGETARRLSRYSTE